MTKYPTALGLNLLSLVITFTGIIFLTLYISYERSFDTFNQNIDTIYQLNFGKESFTIPARSAEVIDGKVSEIEQITPIWFNSTSITTASLKEKNISYFEGGIYAYNSIFDIFSFPLIYGDKKTALTQPFAVVIDESLSQKIFGNRNPVGEKINLGPGEFTITGVMKDIPKEASFQASFIASFMTLIPQEDSWPHRWSEWSFQIFTKVNPKANIAEVNKKINAIDEIDKYFEISKRKEMINVFHLDPLRELHYSNNDNFNIVNPKVLQVLALLIIVLMLMGMVNTINLTTAQAYQKAKALAVKRVMGAQKSKVIGQVVLESVWVSVTAMLLSFLLHRLLLPYLTEMLKIDGFSFEGRSYWYGIFIGFSIVFGVLAGLYPAFYINSPELSQSVKGIQTFTRKGRWIRNSLFIFQFVFATVLIVAALGIAKQLDYWHHFDIGIDKEHVIYFPVTGEINQHKKAFIKELSDQNCMTDYTFAGFVPGNVAMGWGRMVNNQSVNFTCWPVDKRFIDFFGIKILQGRAFSKTEGADDNTFIFNQKAIEEFGWDKPLEIHLNAMKSEGSVIGVCENFNFKSLQNKIEPMAFWMTTGRNDFLLLRLPAGNYTQSIDKIKKTWQKFDPLHDFSSKFLDDSLNELYDKEERISNFIRFVSLWSILLSLTGLLGMVIFNTRNRTKEIGIRKVNGATESEIVKMLNKDFIKWILISFVIAIPVGYYVLQKWLENFAYRIPVSVWLFVTACLVILGVSLVTMSWHTWRVARQNPVESLRYE